MARRSKPRLKGIKTHRNYTVDEVAKALGVSKGTVRRWIKCGLPVLKERKPMLILAPISWNSTMDGTPRASRVSFMNAFA